MYAFLILRHLWPFVLICHTRWFVQGAFTDTTFTDQILGLSGKTPLFWQTGCTADLLLADAQKIRWNYFQTSMQSLLFKYVFKYSQEQMLIYACTYINV